MHTRLELVCAYQVDSMAGKFAAGLPVGERHEFERRQRELGAVLDAQHQQASELSAKLDAVRTCLCVCLHPGCPHVMLHVGA